MNRHDAVKILGIQADISEGALKKRYHELMRMTHPDETGCHDYPYEAHEINSAYEFMLQNIYEIQKKEAKNKEKTVKWNAPVNGNAYIERSIYQYFEDENGDKIGTITIDVGKYMWILDEDFSLFLKSLYEASKKIILLDDEKTNRNRVDDVNLLSNIAYLLAGQFFGADAALGLMKEEDTGVYYTKAMLELDNCQLVPKEGSIIYPSDVKNHRLYVKNDKGNHLGYISFKDDRLLFGIIPLFERRAVLLKMRSGDECLNGRSVNIDMWIKLLPEEQTALESINLKIEKLLK